MPCQVGSQASRLADLLIRGCGALTIGRFLPLGFGRSFLTTPEGGAEDRPDFYDLHEQATPRNLHSTLAEHDNINFNGPELRVLKHWENAGHLKA